MNAFVLQIQIDMPEQLRKFMTQQHNGRTPETVLSNEPLDSVLLTLTSSTPPGTTLHIELVMRDGSVVDYGLIPDNWKNIPASQIPGISVIKIRVRVTCGFFQKDRPVNHCLHSVLTL